MKDRRIHAVGHDMDPFSRNSQGSDVVGERGRNGEDGIGPRQRPFLGSGGQTSELAASVCRLLERKRGVQLQEKRTLEQGGQPRPRRREHRASFVDDVGRIVLETPLESREELLVVEEPADFARQRAGDAEPLDDLFER